GFLPLTGVSIAHCDVVNSVADAYRDLHLLPTQPPNGVRFYSGATGRAYPVTTESAADAILGHATATIDFPRVVESAYADGARLFVEIGPGASCSRMIGGILEGRPHFARSACVAGADAELSLLRFLANMHAEGVGVDFSPLYDGVQVEATTSGRVVTIPVGGNPFEVMPAALREPASHMPAPTNRCAIDTAIMGDLIAARASAADAHAAYLRFAESGSAAMANLLAFHQSLIPYFTIDEPTIVESSPATGQQLPALDTEQCFEFARGSIAKALGPEFATVDAHPTRVRLPDGPLMLVDRILTIEGEPKSLGSGRVVTEHAVRADRWYVAEGH